jgi:mRNA interferase MazF
MQEDRFDATTSITLCVFTTEPTEVPLLRMLIEPTDRNGLSSASRLMVDKVTTVPKARLGRRIGNLNHEDVARLIWALTVFLGLTRLPQRNRWFKAAPPAMPVGKIDDQWAVTARLPEAQVAKKRGQSGTCPNQDQIEKPRVSRAK